MLVIATKINNTTSIAYYLPLYSFLYFLFSNIDKWADFLPKNYACPNTLLHFRNSIWCDDKIMDEILNAEWQMKCARTRFLYGNQVMIASLQIAKKKNYLIFRWHLISTNVHILLIAWLKVSNLEHNRRNSMENKKNNFRMTRLFFSSRSSVLSSFKLHSWDRVFVCRILLNW